MDSPLGLPSPLRAGDVWLTLEGQPVSRALHLGPDSGVVYRAGERLSIGVERDGARLEFAVPLGHWNVQAVLSALGQSLRYEYPTLVGFLVAFLVFYLRSRLVAARLLFLFYMAQVLIFLSRSVEAEAGFAVADGVSRLSYLLTLFFGSLSYLLLLAPLLLHLCLSFPDTKPLLRRFPWLLMLVYLLPWLALAGFMASGTLYASGRTLLFVLTALYSLVSSAVFVHTLIRISSASSVE